MLNLAYSAFKRALDYGRGHAPPGVLGCFDRQASERFVVAAERGGAGEFFGNLVLRFERPALRQAESRSPGAGKARRAQVGRHAFHPLRNWMSR
jgi:hypothetical protein